MEALFCRYVQSICLLAVDILVQIYFANTFQQITYSIMVFYPAIARHYFVKTQTYVALFGPQELSLIFSDCICLELTSL